MALMISNDADIGVWVGGLEETLASDIEPNLARSQWMLRCEISINWKKHCSSQEMKMESIEKKHLCMWGLAEC
eukprot:scaffold22021_cov51-Attheya_sp.AAC.2